jgi:cell division control protein 6
MPEILEFKPYNYEETKGIMKQRMEYAFHPNVWDNNAFEMVAKKTAEIQDIRTGLYLMKQAGLIAEDKSSRKITLEHAQLALEKIKDFSIKNPNELAEDEQMILELVKQASGKKIGDFYKLYQQNGGKLVYKSFQRKIDKLQKSKFIIVEKTAGGEDGNTTIIKHNSEKKLTDFP